MSKELKTLQKQILNRCKGIKELFGSLEKQPPRHLAFLNRLPEIELKAKRRPEHAEPLLDALLRDLKAAEDGTGSTILNPDRFERFEKFFV